MKILFFLIGVLFAAPVVSDPLGLWVVPAGDAVISVEAHDADYRLRLVSLMDSTQKDANNPDRSVRNSSLSGSVIGDDFRLDDGVLKGGWIYDPESGKTYKCRIQVQDDGLLSVTGYIGIPRFGRAQRWRRFEDFEASVKAMIQAVHHDQ